MGMTVRWTVMMMSCDVNVNGLTNGNLESVAS